MEDLLCTRVMICGGPDPDPVCLEEGTHAFQEPRPPRVDRPAGGRRSNAVEKGHEGGGRLARGGPNGRVGGRKDVFEISRPDYTKGVMDGLICEI